MTNSYSKKEKILYFVAQGSALQLLLFNIDLADSLPEGKDDNVNSYADDPTPILVQKTCLL